MFLNNFKVNIRQYTTNLDHVFNEKYYLIDSIIPNLEGNL